MKVTDEVEHYLNSLPTNKRAELDSLHQRMLLAYPHARLWFFDGKNEQGKVVSNPSIGYGQYTITYADGKTKEFYRIGISGNTTGISVYVLGIEDKNYLSERYGAKIGKATVTGYCIKFNSLKNIDMAVLEAAIRDRMEQT
jgi:hypothetical protein